MSSGSYAYRRPEPIRAAAARLSLLLRGKENLQLCTPGSDELADILTSVLAEHGLAAVPAEHANSHASSHGGEQADLRHRYADAIKRVLEQPNGWAYRGTLPDALLAVRDDELAEARRHAAQAEAALIAEVARTCGADLDAPRTHKELPNVAALALDAARDLRADYEQAVARLEHADTALVRVRDLAARLGRTDPGLQAEILAALNGPTTEEPHA